MSEWMQLLLTTISAPILGGVGWWFKTRRDDRIARELGYVARIKELQEEVKALQQDARTDLQEQLKREMTRADSAGVTLKVQGDMMALLRDMAQTLTMISGKVPPQ